MKDITFPSIVLYKQFDEGRTEYTGRYDIKSGKSLWTRKGLEDFVQLEGTPSYYEWLCARAPALSVTNVHPELKVFK